LAGNLCLRYSKLEALNPKQGGRNQNEKANLKKQSQLWNGPNGRKYMLYKG